MIATEDVQGLDAKGWSFQLVSRQGLVRKRNEDTAIVLTDVHLAGRRVHAMAVFDGVGGWPSGDVAAQTAREAFAQVLRRAPGAEAVMDALHEEVRAGGTTATIALLDADERPGDVTILNVGDSAAWRIGDRVEALTTVAQPGEPLRAALGWRVDCTVARTHVGKGEAVVLTTDGVHGFVEMETVEPLAPGWVERLLERVEGEGAWDNATVVVGLRT